MVAWSDSVGFKSLAAVYKDAEKEKDVLSFDELKAKYEGKLVFNSAEPNEKQFMCAIENVNLVGFANENKCIVINGILQNLKNSKSFSFNPEVSLNLKGGIVSNYAAAFNSSHTRWFFVRFGGGIYQQPIGLFRSFDDPTFGRWSIVNEVRAEKKVWGRWYGYKTDFYGRFNNLNSRQLSVYNGNNPGVLEHRMQPYGSDFTIWTTGVTEAQGIIVRIDPNGNYSIINK